MNVRMTLVPISMWAALFTGFAACASSNLSGDVDSVREHEAAADAEKAEARAHADRFDPMAVRYAAMYPQPLRGCDKSLAGSCSPHWTMTTNPTEYELGIAAAHLERAKKHRQAAQALRDAETRACSQIAFRDRDLSPLLRQRDIERVEEIGASDGYEEHGTSAGAAIIYTIVPGLTTEVLQHIADCHLARNAALGFEQNEYNDPLNVRGAMVTVRTVNEHVVMEVTAKEANAALEIVHRAQTLANPGESVSSGR